MAYGQGGWRRRNMYYLTGLPGWMRFGYPPGWMGRSSMGTPLTGQPLVKAPAHGDCANFRNGFCTLYGTAVDPNGPACPNFTPRGSVPAAQTPTQPPPPAPVGFPPAQVPQLSREQEIQILQNQARMVEQQLEQVKKRLEELKRR